jgi:hypothetical protein
VPRTRCQTLRLVGKPFAPQVRLGCSARARPDSGRSNSSSSRRR